MAAEKSGQLDRSTVQAASFFQGQVDTVTDLKKNSDNLVIRPYWNKNKRGFWIAWTMYPVQEKQERKKKERKV